MARRRPNMTEKLAACLCEITRGGVPLIPEALRMNGTAKEICAAVDFDHAVPWTWTQDNRPQNLSPMLRADHREKTRTRDVKEIARVRRGLKKRAATLSGGQRQMLGVARALMSDPRVLILDEPSAGLAPAVLELSLIHI